MNKNLPITLSLLLIAAAVAGCNAYPTAKQDFGDSVRHMVQSQRVSTEPVDTEPVRTGDGQRLNSVLEVYRTGVSRPEQSSGQPVVFDIGASLPQ
jgi:hypothetical protein